MQGKERGVMMGCGGGPSWGVSVKGGYVMNMTRSWTGQKERARGIRRERRCARKKQGSKEKGE